MRPTKNMEKLLQNMRIQTPKHLDERVYHTIDMAAKRMTLWRKLMTSPITKLAIAAAVLAGFWSLAQCLIGQDRTTLSPTPKIVQVPDESIKQNSFFQVEQQEAQSLFKQSDVPGLLTLLETCLPNTKIEIAGYLGLISDATAINALQPLAETWQGQSEDNPYQMAIQQIQKRLTELDASEPNTLMDKRSSDHPPQETGQGAMGVTLKVVEDSTGEPLQGVTISTSIKQIKNKISDEQGQCVLEIGASLPNLVQISFQKAGFVPQSIRFQPTKKALPKVIYVELETGTSIGGIIQEANEIPISDATIEMRYSRQQTIGEPYTDIHLLTHTDENGLWQCTTMPEDISGLINVSVSHPNFADARFQTPMDLSLKELRELQAPMVLTQGVSVLGTVLDTSGHPISTARLLAGTHYQEKTWTQTDQDGYFLFPHLKPRHTPMITLTAQAKGFAPQIRQIRAVENMGPIEFVLEPGHPLKGKVVDQQKQPIQDAWIVLEKWNGFHTLDVQRKTDANGNFSWNSAPVESFEIRIMKEGYKAIQQDVLADGLEQAFVLASPPNVTGTVVDSQTKKSLKTFGFSVSFQRQDQHSGTRTQWMTDGVLTYSVTKDCDTYQIYVEAQGYKPQMSRVIDPNEQDVILNFELVKNPSAEMIAAEGYVLDAQGLPVADAEVYSEANPRIKDGQLMRLNPSIKMVRTNQQGYFAFESSTRHTPLVAICDQGIAKVSFQELMRQGNIVLQPWAQVSGDLVKGTMPAVLTRLELSYPKNYVKGVSLDTYTAKTDEMGHFEFERVYPHSFKLYNKIYTVLPGESLTLHLGGSGRTVMGQIDFQQDSNGPDVMFLQLVPLNNRVHEKPLPVPSGFEYMSLEDVQLWIQDQPGIAASSYQENLSVVKGSHHTFHIENVEPGQYAVYGYIRESTSRMTPPKASTIERKTLVHVWHEFEVPLITEQAQLDIPLDLGMIDVLGKDLTRGDIAPILDLPALNTKRLRLSDYEGQVLLLCFSHGGHTTPGSTLDQIAQIYEMFADSPSFSFAFVMNTHHALWTQKQFELAGLDLRCALVQSRTCRVFTEYNVPLNFQSRLSPWYVLINPLGEIAAIGLKGDELIEAIEMALE